MAQMKEMTVHLSAWSIIRILSILLGVWVLFTIREVLLLLFLVILVVSVVEPTVEWLQQKIKLPKALGIIGIYLILLAFLGFVVALLVPLILQQIRDLSIQLPNYINLITQSDFLGIISSADSQAMVQSLRTGLNNLQDGLFTATTSGIFSSITSLFGGLFSFIVVLVMAFYVMLEEDSIKNVLKFVVPADYQPYLIRLYKRIQTKIGLWLRGYLILALIMWGISFAVLTAFGVEYALVLSMLAALTEIIPFVGPILAGIPAVGLAFVQSPITGLGVFIAYVILNSLESNVLVPKVMQKNLGLNPVLIIIAILVGVQLGGVIGAVLAIPVLTTLSVFVSDVFSRELALAQEQEENEETVE